MAGVVLLSGSVGVQTPVFFRVELFAIGAVGIVLIGISFFRQRVFGYVAFGWLLMMVAVVRVALGPGDVVLVLLLSALAVAATISSAAGRRSAGAAAIAVAAFLPTPGRIFGAPAPPVDAGAIAAILAVAPAALCAIELLTHLIERVDEERRRNDRLESGMQSLAQVNVGFQEYSQNIGERSKQEERNRITRDVHDTVGYSLTNIAVMLDAAVGLIDRDVPRVRTMLHKGREQVDTAHAEVRRALHALRALASAEEFGVRNLLHIGDQFAEATDVSVDIDFGNATRSYGPHTDATLSRLVQEGLANAFRHGGATEVSVRLWQSDSQLTLTIRDNGRGSEVIEEGIGFVGMQERLSQIDGRLSWQSLSTGFVLTAEVVLPAEQKQRSV